MPRLRFLFALLVVLTLSAFTGKTADQYDKDNRVAKITWKAACSLSKYNCKGVKAPAVRRSGMIGDASAYGAYWTGSTVIWLDTSEVMKAGTQMWLTIFHEQIHYLQFRGGVIQQETSRFLDCLVEREAMELTNEYVDYLNAAQSYKRTLAEWRRIYSCNPSSQQGM